MPQEKPIYNRTCPNCGQVFRTTNAMKLYCSFECYTAARNRRKWALKKARIKKENQC